MAKTVDLKTRYNTEIVNELKKSLSIKNTISVPKVTKVTINTGIGTYLKGQGNKDFSPIVESIKAISGQQPVLNKAKKAVSNFKVREGDTLGVSVTLRGKRMYDFLDKLINIVFPRVRDFRGISRKAFDGNGNYSIGFKEHIVFPEISPDDIMRLHGLQINVITNAKTDEEGLELLSKLGFPFKKTN